MKLSAKAMVATRWESIDVANLGSDAPSTTFAAGFKIVTRTRPGAAAAAASARHVSIELTRTGSSAPAWLREPTRIILVRPQVFDSRGRRLMTNLFDVDWFGKMFRIELEPDGPPQQAKLGEADHLRLEIPTEVGYHDVHFEFQDLALN
jgi:hypothetical protein